MPTRRLASPVGALPNECRCANEVSTKPAPPDYSHPITRRGGVRHHTARRALTPPHPSRRRQPGTGLALATIPVMVQDMVAAGRMSCGLVVYVGRTGAGGARGLQT